METWAYIDGYDDLYRISSIGIIKNRSGLIIQQRKDRKGYKLVNLNKNGVGKTYQVHRLVAKAFIANAYDMPLVNHRNGIRWDNNKDNLEWVSHSYNQRHAYYIGLRRPKTKKVLCNQNGIEYGSIKMAAIDLGINRGDISQHLLGKLRAVKGYTFVTV